jgi:uncharacterized protein
MEVNHRRCVACRRVAHKQDFWRIVRVYPSCEVCLDQGSGRSAYLCPREECLKAIQKKNRLAKALKAHVPDSLFDQLAKRLTKRSPDSLH